MYLVHCSLMPQHVFHITQSHSLSIGFCFNSLQNVPHSSSVPKHREKHLSAALQYIIVKSAPILQVTCTEYPRCWCILTCGCPLWRLETQVSWRSMRCWLIGWDTYSRSCCLARGVVSTCECVTSLNDCRQHKKTWTTCNLYSKPK